MPKPLAQLSPAPRVLAPSGPGSPTVAYASQREDDASSHSSYGSQAEIAKKVAKTVIHGASTAAAGANAALDKIDDAKLLNQLNDFARMINFKLTVPFINMKVGLPIGKLPVAGGLAHSVIGALILASAARHNMNKLALGGMTLRLLVGATVGSIPLVGGMTGAAYKANTANLAALNKFLAPRGGPNPVAAADKQRKKGWLRPHTLFVVAAVPAGAALATTAAAWCWVLQKVGVL